MLGRLAAALRASRRTAHELVEAARAADRAGDAALAERWYRKALSREPGSAQAHQGLARNLARGGRLDEALGLLEQALARDPRDAALRLELGNVLRLRRDFPAAIANYRRALELEPANLVAALQLADLYLATDQPSQAETLLAACPQVAEVHRLVGYARLAMGRYREAIDALVESFESDPKADTAFNIGVAFNNTRCTLDARSWLEKAVTLDPRHFDALYALARLHLQDSEYETAESYLRSCVEVRHDHAEAHANLGLACLRLGRNEDAIDCAELAVHFNPDFAPAYHVCGLAEMELKRHAAARESMRKAVELLPESTEYLCALAVVYQAEGRFQEAVDEYHKALAIKPSKVEILNNLGLAYTEMGKAEEAAAVFERALEIDPAHVQVRSNLGLAYKDVGRIDEAFECFRRALALDPDFGEARWNAAVIRLREGDFERGWLDYETRWSRREARECPFHFPQWTGEALGGRRVLVFAEQGLGDQIMFASCLHELIDLAGEVYVECTAKLEPLFRRSFPRATVLGSASLRGGPPAWLDRLPKVDYQIAIGSLPLRLDRRGSRFPRHQGYLKADPSRIAYWRERLDALGPGNKIGISWQGGVIGTRRRLRSLPLGEFVPLLEGVPARFVSLQYTECADEIAALQAEHGIELHHWQDAIDDYDETAALVCALDLVVSVCTAVIHLAGGLGKPCLVMAPVSPEWRYGRTGTGMPWYPSVTLIRQEKVGDWESVIQRAREQALRLLSPRTGGVTK